METVYVHQVYDKIAHHFDHTRFSVWKCVKSFLNNLESYSVVGDWGCGNGKNMLYRTDLVFYGFDRCQTLVDIAHSKGLNVCHGDCLSPPYSNESFDAIISIAVIHHIANYLDRVRVVQQLVEKLRKGGQALITVWALEQPKKAKWEDIGEGNFLIPWHNKNDGVIYTRLYHLFSEDEIKKLFSIFERCIVIKRIEYELGNWCVVFEKL